MVHGHAGAGTSRCTQVVSDRQLKGQDGTGHRRRCREGRGCRIGISKRHTRPGRLSPKIGYNGAVNVRAASGQGYRAAFVHRLIRSRIRSRRNIDVIHAHVGGRASCGTQIVGDRQLESQDSTRQRSRRRKGCSCRIGISERHTRSGSLSPKIGYNGAVNVCSASAQGHRAAFVHGLICSCNRRRGNIDVLHSHHG